MVFLVINAYLVKAVHSANMVCENKDAENATAGHSANMIFEKTDATTAEVLPYVNLHGAKHE